MSGFNKDYTYGGNFTYGGTGIYGGLPPQERIKGLDSTYIENDGDSFLSLANIQAGVATNPTGLKYNGTHPYDGNYPYNVSFMNGQSSNADIDVIFTGSDEIDII